jgi:glucose/mannose-6-phosphate isomerase
VSSPLATVTAADVETWREREAEIDAQGMRAHIAGFPDQLAAGTDSAASFVESLDVPTGGPTAVAVAGMGGSAIGGDLVAASTADQRSLPLHVIRGYELPQWLDQGTTLIVSSYSGNTEETIACYEAAQRRGLTVVAIATGGRVADMARGGGDPLLELPTGFPPRAALGHSLSAVALVTARLDPVLDAEADADRLRCAAERLRPLSERWLEWSDENPALDIAASIANRLPIVYGGHPTSISAAARWKAQLNENGKIPAYSGELPEHNHNEIVGFEGDIPVVRQIVLVHLETPWDHPQVRSRFDFVHDYCDGRVAGQHRIMATGDVSIEGMLELCYLGDCTSFIVSIINGRNPTPVASIDALKNKLKG